MPSWILIQPVLRLPDWSLCIFYDFACHCMHWHERILQPFKWELRLYGIGITKMQIAGWPPRLDVNDRTLKKLGYYHLNHVRTNSSERILDILGVACISRYVYWDDFDKAPTPNVSFHFPDYSRQQYWSTVHTNAAIRQNIERRHREIRRLRDVSAWCAAQRASTNNHCTHCQGLYIRHCFSENEGQYNCQRYLIPSPKPAAGVGGLDGGSHIRRSRRDLYYSRWLFV